MTQLAEFQLSEGVYNARDVLSMCRSYNFLVDAVIRTNTEQVYAMDRELAKLALQMTRCGMPIDEEERKRVGDHLRQIRDDAVTALRKYTEPPYFEDFAGWVASFQAHKVRKASGKRPADPDAGVTDPVTGLPESYEGAYMRRQQIRREEFSKKVERARMKGKEPFNFGAKVQQAAILRAAGVPLLKTTAKTPIPKVSKETLEDFGHHAAARLMLQYTLCSAIIRGFIEGEIVKAGKKKGKMKGIVVGADGRLHADWSIHKITGRWGSNPNVQNWSKRAGGGAENLRRMVCAPPGYKLVGADQKQLEARLIAACSQDPFLLDIFNRGADIHGEFALVCFPAAWPKLAETFAIHKKGTTCTEVVNATGDFSIAAAAGFVPNTQQSGPPFILAPGKKSCGLCEQRDKVRDLTKRLEYGGFYAGSDETLWKSVVKDYPDLRITDVQAFLRAMNERMQGVRRHQANLLKQAVEKGEIRSPILGRREVFPLGRVDPSVIYNFEPQSGGADLWALGAVAFAERWDQDGDEARIFHNGHDSVNILTRIDKVEAVSADVHACWEREWNGVQFLMDVKVGDRWSEV